MRAAVLLTGVTSLGLAAAGLGAAAGVTAATDGARGTIVQANAPAGPAGPVLRGAPTLKFGSCSGFGLSSGNAQCAFLRVPMDWSKPNGKKISLAVSRVRATAPDAQYQGVMLVNPGGPGGSGLGFSALQDAIPDGAGRSYDWIGFDPRGVGQSKPAISCIEDYAAAGRPVFVPSRSTGKLAGSEKAWLALSKKYAKACGSKHGALLENMRTTDTVRDMDALRAALGEAKINFYGFSYGTYLGQVYATMYPERVRRMVLDGNVDPRNVWYDAQLSQDRAFEVAATEFFGWMAKHERNYDLGSSASAVRTKYFAVLKKLRKGGPIDGIGEPEWTDVFVRGMYAEFLWPEIADVLADFVHNDSMASANVAFKQAAEPDDNGFAVYNAVQCTDNKWPQSYTKTWRPDAVRTAAKAPFLTWSNVWFNTPCLYWPAKSGRPVEVDGGAAPPMLLVNSTLDAATPYSGALAVRSLFPRARLIAEKGQTTHSNTLNGNKCVDNRVAAYLKDGSLPTRKPGNGADLECARTPLPEPGFTRYGNSQAPAAAPAPAAPLPAPEAMLDEIIGLLPSRAL